jgi:phosphohistidine swiveling domain-containing protein
MMGRPLFTQTLYECHDVAVAGGKAVNLGRLLRAGFPVPDGFVVTTHAYRLAQAHSPVAAFSAKASAEVPANALVEAPAEVAEDIRRAYREMGGGQVAVRSSATAEDMAAASMAGQYETYLDIEGEAALLDSVRRCWAGIDAPRTGAYLREHGIDPLRVSMAVVVQRLVPADVAGVLFTTNPQNGARREMLIEASWGLGESVVSGQVQPDALRLDQDTGRVLGVTIGEKSVHRVAGTQEEQPVEESRRRQPCLRGRDVYRLWQLGQRAVEHFGAPQDIEWAIHAEELYLLQSRPITTLADADARERALCAARRHLRGEVAAGRGPWVLHNLAETLPHPTPLTWSVIGRFMSGAGGLGTMYRQAGFEPSPAADCEGFLERIAGRVFMDASRAPEMFFQDFPFAYDLEELKRSPEASQMPPTLPRGSLFSRWKSRRRLIDANAKLHALSASCDRVLRDTLFAGMVAYVSNAKQIDLPCLTAEQLIGCWQEHEKQVLDTFGPQSLMPSLLCGMAMAELRTFLAEHFWDEEPGALANLISSGGSPNRTVAADAELYAVRKENRSLEAWLAEHGHRAPGELDLASPRWREQPAAVEEMAARLAGGDNPLERHRCHGDAVDRRTATLRDRLSRRDRREFDRRVDLVRRYVAFREDGKDFLMLGYDLLRDVAMEAGRRLDVEQDVFYLTRDELFDALRTGYAPYHAIQQRKAAYRIEARLHVPRFVDEQAIDTLGEVPERKPKKASHQAFAVSSGEASGPARILGSPTETGDLGRGYILICPSTDPSWTPLFANAGGLVLERGGTLSHGAVVAREMGLPAVVLPDATQLFHDGEVVCVDADRGRVSRASEPELPALPAAAGDPDDVRIPPELIPPPPGRKDRLAARLRNSLALVWIAYLLGAFLLPEPWVFQPTLSVMDGLLWSLVCSWGKPAAVAMIAAAVASLMLVLQKCVTDNRRLLEAKRRATVLNKLAGSLPKDSSRRAAMLRLASTMPLRTLGTSMVPVGLLLGPLVMLFAWLSHRVDPSVAGAAAGSAVQIVATVDGQWSEPVQISVPAPVVVDDATPSTRTLPPIRETLERLLALYRQPRNDPDEPWELKAAPDLARQQTADDLQQYLSAGIAPQGITWRLQPPEDWSGRFPVTVSTEGHPPVTVDVAIGEEYPSTPQSAIGPVGSPVNDLRAVYPASKWRPVFWQPLASLAIDDPVAFVAWLAAIDVGWLWLYIAAYLVALLLVRAILRVA